MKASDPAWLCVEAWRPVDAPLKGTPAARSARLLEDVLAQFDVVNAARYQPRNGTTFCNIAVSDWTLALGCEVPHWVDAKGRPAKVGRGREQDANAVVEWLQARRGGWRGVTTDDARARASFGFPVVIGWHNPGGIGHVAMLLPDGTIAQAGKVNLWRAPLARGFGTSRAVLYFTHD